MIDWQPIDTAPRDETDILLAAFIWAEWRFAVAAWFENEWLPFDMSVEIPFTPTHWMPLPQPPVMDNEARR